MKKYIGIILAIVIFVTQLSLVRGVGMTWDEPASFFIGRMNLQFWQTLDWTNVIDYLNTKRFASSPMYFVSGEELYPPFPFLVSSAASYILAERTNIMDSISAHHVGEILLGSIGVAAFYGLGIELGLTFPIAVGTTLIFALYPVIFGQMRNDAKDIPLMSMLVLSVYIFFRFLRAWRERKMSESWGWGFLWAVALGLAEDSKPSAAIIVLILGVWFFASLLINQTFRKKMKQLPLFLFSVASFGVLAVAIFFIAWPWLWDNPVKKIEMVFAFFRSVGYYMPVLYSGQLYRAGISLPRSYPYAILLFQTPIEITALAVVGMLTGIWGVIKKQNVWYLFLLLWFWIGMGRFLLPGFLIYAKVRHFIDVMPAFFLLAGVGVTYIGSWLDKALRSVHILSTPIKQHNLSGPSDHILRDSGAKSAPPRAFIISLILISVVIIHEIIISETFYPYEPSYFNFLVGGSKTVAQKHLFDIEYWGSSTREAMTYIDNLGDAPISVYSCLMRHLTMYYNTPNVTMQPDHPEYASYTLVPNSPSWFGESLKFSKDLQTPVYVVRRGGADLFYVYKNTSHFGYRCGNETLTTYGYKTP